MNFKKISRNLLVGSVMVSGVGSLFASSVDVSQLPLGDGKITTLPKVGYIYTCPSPTDGGGTETNGSWIHGSTWNLKEKLQVGGSVTWPKAQFTIGKGVESGRTIYGNGLPVDTITGTFPIASTDPAYVVDRNPNSITTQVISYTLPTRPLIAQVPSCLPMGTIGIALNGVAIFDALDAKSRDAVAHEAQDVCSGHPERQGMYHYHGASSCLPHQSENAALVGYALDGFGIYSNHDVDGNEIATKDLDECHGMTSEILWNGKKVSMYHYVVTQDYPYTIGCFKGTPTKATSLHTLSGGVLSDLKQGTTTSSIIIFSNDLSFGDKGDDVAYLQTVLEKGGYISIPKGSQKGFFGKFTKEALKKFQKANGIPTTGVFGPKTRLFYNSKNGHMEKNIKSPPQRGTNKDSIKDVVSVENNHDIMTHSSTTSLQREGGAGQTSGTSIVTDYVQMSASGGQQSGMDQDMGMLHNLPKEAADSCDPKEEGETCSFVTQESVTITGTCQEIQETLACVPSRP